MIREKEIYQAAKECCQKNIPNLPQMHFVVETAFEAGAKWADEHPKSPWHFVADGDLPPIDKVVLCTNGTDISLGVYNRHFYDPSPWKDCERLPLVKYWMEIPKLPTELK